MSTHQALRRCACSVAMIGMLAAAGSATADDDDTKCNNKCQNQKIAQLEATVVALQNALVALQTQVTEHDTEIDEQQATLGCMSKVGDDVFFTGCNVRIVNGMGGTGTINGVGNLIVGYDERAEEIFSTQPPSEKTGSHNIVVGAGHTYKNRGGLVAGLANRIEEQYATVTGGLFNVARGRRTSVAGGWGNRATADYATVTGGRLNIAGGLFSNVSGGFMNSASGNLSSVSGGQSNAATAQSSSVCGGINNNASNDQASVSGGSQNLAAGFASSVSGGTGNTAGGDYSSVSGGANRSALEFQNWAAGNLLELN